METTSARGHRAARVEAVEAWLEATKDEGDKVIIPVGRCGPLASCCGSSTSEKMTSAFQPACCGDGDVIFERFGDFDAMRCLGGQMHGAADGADYDTEEKLRRRFAEYFRSGFCVACQAALIEKIPPFLPM